MINDTECLFKSREKEYQETIDQIEVKFHVCVCAFFFKLYQGHYVILASTAKTKEVYFDILHELLKEERAFSLLK